MVFSKVINDLKIINHWERVALHPLSTTGRPAGGNLSPKNPSLIRSDCSPTQTVWWLFEFLFQICEVLSGLWRKGINMKIYNFHQFITTNRLHVTTSSPHSVTEKLNPSYWHFIALTHLLCRQQQTCSPSTKQLLQTMTLTMLRSQTIVSPSWLRH